MYYIIVNEYTYGIYETSVEANEVAAWLQAHMMNRRINVVYKD